MNDLSINRRRLGEIKSHMRRTGAIKNEKVRARLQEWFLGPFGGDAAMPTVLYAHEDDSLVVAVVLWDDKIFFVRLFLIGKWEISVDWSIRANELVDLAEIVK